MLFMDENEGGENMFEKVVDRTNVYAYNHSITQKHMFVKNIEWYI